MRSSMWGPVAFMVTIILVVAAGYWYVAVYDTASGKCDRGDAEACAVLASHAMPSPWPTIQPVPLVSQPGGARIVGLDCEWRVAGHDAFILGWVRGGETCSQVSEFLPPSFTALPAVSSTEPPANSEMAVECSTYAPTWSVEVIDVIGGAGFGTTACEGGLAPYVMP